MSDKQASTIILRLRTGADDLIALAAVDPRWRLSQDASYGGVAALLDGVPQPIPLTGLKFIGGLVDEGETPESSALRELREEAGPRIARLVEASGMRRVYRMRRALEWRAGAGIEILYYGATVDVPPSGLADLFEPADDCLAIVLVRTAQVSKGPEGYAVTGSPVATFWRKAYRTIPFEGWNLTPAVQAAMASYNELGPGDPFVGIDRDSLSAMHVPLYCPGDASPTDDIRPGDDGTGRPVPDGAVLMRFLGKVPPGA